jgi:DNA-binding transcriptional regulator YiaG
VTPREIRELREKFNLTRQKFAIAIGVGERTVARWEGGDSVPSPLAMEKIRLFASEHGIMLPV